MQTVRNRGITRQLARPTRLVALAVLALGVSPGLAQEKPAGPPVLIRTLSGQRLAGAARLQAGGLRLTETNGHTRLIALSNLAEVVFAGGQAAESPSEANGGTGFLGFYFNHTNLTGPFVARLDETVNFDWGWKTSIMPKVNPDYFGVRWMAQLQPPATDDYTFYFGTDDGGRFWVDGQGPFSLWERQEYTETNVTMRLEAGQRYDVWLEFFDFFGNAKARFFWSTPSLPKSVVPRKHLHAASFSQAHPAQIGSLPGLLATYYEGDAFQGHSFSRIDPRLNFEWRCPLPPDLREAREQWRQAAALAERTERELAGLRQAHGLPQPNHDQPELEAEKSKEFLNRQKRALRRLEEAEKQHERAAGKYQKLLEEVETLKKRKKSDQEIAGLLEKARQNEAEEKSALEAARQAAANYNEALAQELRWAQIAVSNRVQADQLFERLLELSHRPGRHEVAPGVPANFFSVRWTGHLRVGTSEPYQFYLTTDEGARLWLGGRLAIDNWAQTQTGESTCVTQLWAGQRCDIMLETRNTDDHGVARLSWSTPSMARAVIPQESLSPFWPMAESEAGESANSAFPAGALLANGILISAPFEQADESVVRFKGLLHDQPVSLGRVARLYLRPLTDTFAILLEEKKRPGVLLQKGDFLEGEFLGLDGGNLKVRSVLFGLRHYPVGAQAVAFLVRPAKPPAPRFTLKLRDGAIISTPDLALTEAAVLLPGNGGLLLQQEHLLFIRRLE